MKISIVVQVKSEKPTKMIYLKMIFKVITTEPLRHKLNSLFKNLEYWKYRFFEN